MKPNKPWKEMTVAELRQATKDLNGSVLGKTRPLNAAERAYGKNPQASAQAMRKRVQNVSA